MNIKKLVKIALGTAVIIYFILVILSTFWYLKIDGDQCIFKNTFECEGGVMQIYVDESNDLFVAGTIHSKELQNIYHVKVLCTDAEKTDINSGLFFFSEYGGNIPILVNSVDPKGSFEAIDVPCVDSEGNQLKSGEGSSFEGFIVVEYTLESNPNLKEIEIGTLEGTVIK